jgi:hypothetical protein
MENDTAANTSPRRAGPAARHQAEWAVGREPMTETEGDVS